MTGVIYQGSLVTLKHTEDSESIVKSVQYEGDLKTRLGLAIVLSYFGVMVSGCSMARWHNGQSKSVENRTDKCRTAIFGTSVQVIAWFGVLFGKQTHTNEFFNSYLRSLKKSPLYVFPKIAREIMLLPINNIHEESIYSAKKGNSMQITVLPYLALFYL